MAIEIAAGSDRESQAEVDAVLAETRVTMDQVRRWRREGLLPDVVQEQAAYRGSVVLYPKGTCAEIRAASGLFKQKNRVDYVGLRLWRLGFPVDEKFWRPHLRRQARMLDRVIPLLTWAISRFNRDWQKETFYDYAARRLRPVNDVILSRIKGRVDSERLPTFLRVIGDVGTGDFEGFEALIAGEEENNDRALTIRALDLANAGSHSILGKKLNLIELLPSGLGNVSAAMSMGNFERIADGPAEDLEGARNDAINAVAIGLYHYEATRWIYGDGAFGLRLLAWIARKAPDALVENMMLLMFRLRQVPGALMPSEQLAALARQASENFKASKQYELAWRNDPHFAEILDPKRIKLAFADEIALKRWHSELNAIILQVTGKPPMGAIDDSQEVGKSH